DVAAFVTVMKIESRLSGSPGLTALMNTPPGPTAVIVPSPSPDTVAMVGSALLQVTDVAGSATPRPLRKSKLPGAPAANVSPMLFNVAAVGTMSTNAGAFV